MFTFPSTPTVGQVYVAPNNVKYQWDGLVWSSSGEQPPTVVVSPTPPVEKKLGDVYFDNNDTMRAYVWIGTAWVDLSPGGGGN